MIDLRSDTVTLPTEPMIEAMFSAKVGDDVFGEDPSINALEDKSANMFGMDAALYCPSGTMTNQIAIRCHVKPGEEVICDQTAHIYNYEGGGIGANSGASVRLIDGERGKILPEQIVDSVNPYDYHYPVSKLASIENTSNKGGGSFYSIQEMIDIKEVCIQHNLAYHLDGARIFNALVAMNENAQSLSGIFDSISICLSKGLGAPMGSLLLGSNDFIENARRMRKMMGGGMRQAGYMAAAGIYALENHIDRLKEDHNRAAELGKVLINLSFVQEIQPIETNIVIFKLQASMERDRFISLLKDSGILVVPLGNQVVRMVTHMEITDSMINEVLNILKSITK